MVLWWEVCGGENRQKMRRKKISDDHFQVARSCVSHVGAPRCMGSNCLFVLI